MDASSEAVDQIVRIALQGTETTLRLTGAGAKNVAAMLVAACASTEKTRGKATLSAMLKSGKELRVLAIKSEDLKTFAEEAKRYGIVYAVVKQKGEASAVDLLVRAEDASKVNRIAERCGFARVTQEEVSVAPAAPAKEKRVETKDAAEALIGELRTPSEKKEQRQADPFGKAQTREARSSITSKGESAPGKATREKKSLRALMRSIEKERAATRPVAQPVKTMMRKTPVKGR